MGTPWDKEEYKIAESWIEIAKQGQLEVIPCISGWMDICGFGSSLEKYEWNLVDLQKHGVLELLSRVYQRVGHPFLIGVEPMPFESVLVINDGIARTVDLRYPEYVQAVHIIFYLRDLFFAHKGLLNITASYGFGIRTVFAGGERVQYSPTIYTGNSILFHDDKNISEFGQRLLKKNFLYNPAEFQMNTAFSKSYSIDSLGTKGGFKVNYCYVESSFWDNFATIPLITLEKKEASLLINFNSLPALEVYFSDEIFVEFKGLTMIVNQVSNIRITKEFEGEETCCDITHA